VRAEVRGAAGGFLFFFAVLSSPMLRARTYIYSLPP
jgi:hypothetical protein